MRKVTIFVHEETNKIVSKVCHGCGEIKLSEEFDKVRTTINLSSRCKDCLRTPAAIEKRKATIKRKQELAKALKESEKAIVKAGFQDLDETLKKYEEKVGGNK